MIPNPLIPGAVYQTVQGPMTFVGLDYYRGETTYHFEYDSCITHYVNQEDMKHFILPTGADK